MPLPHQLRDARGWRQLAERASAQGGAFSGGQAHEAGLSDEHLATALGRGWITRVSSGVFRVGGAPPSLTADAHAALLAVTVTAAVSHSTAAALLGLPRVPHLGLEVTVLGTSLPLRDGVRWHRTIALPARDLCDVGGLPVTAGPRTILDVAGRIAPADVTALVDHAVCARVASRGALWALATRFGQARKHAAHIRRLTSPQAEGEFRSWLEREFRRGVLRAHGLPLPEWNVPVRDSTGRIGLVDCLWPCRPLIVELEGLRFHTLPAARRRDAGRFNRLGGVARVLRFTWEDVVRSPADVAEQVRRALGGG